MTRLERCEASGETCLGFASCEVNGVPALADVVVLVVVDGGDRRVSLMEYLHKYTQQITDIFCGLLHSPKMCVLPRCHISVGVGLATLLGDNDSNDDDHNNDDDDRSSGTALTNSRE